MYSPVALRQLAEAERLIKAKMYSIYAIYNKKHDKFYIGQSNNLDERLNAHDDKRFANSYTTRFDGEWKLIFKEDVATRSQALMREKQLKSFRGREFIRNFIPR